MSDSPPELLDEPEVLLFETSPFGNLDAIVQHNGQSVYLYLNERVSGGGRPVFGTRACWVRNLAQGPLVLNEAQMKQGIAPMLPRTHTVNREGEALPNPEDLAIIWLEEGNGAALIENPSDNHTDATILAVIPPWSGMDEFQGYAHSCAVESPVCWPMPDNPALAQRIEDANQFWTAFDQKPDPFAQLQPEILQLYQHRFAKLLPQSQPDPNYFSIDGGKFPPRGLVEYIGPSESVWLTVGMSLCRQPMVELYSDRPTEQRRIELGFRWQGPPPEDALAALARETLSRLAGYPWSQFNWLGQGHTCQIGNLVPESKTAMLAADRPANPATTDPEPLTWFRHDPVNLLWLNPVTEEQRIQLESQADRA